MMELDVQDWKVFIVEKLFDSIYKAKAHTNIIAIIFLYICKTP